MLEFKLYLHLFFCFSLTDFLPLEKDVNRENGAEIKQK